MLGIKPTLNRYGFAWIDRLGVSARMSVGHSSKRAAADPAYCAWGGTPYHPDLDRLNPRFFDSLEGVLREMQARGTNAELLLLNFYRTPFTDPEQWTPARERLWLHYVLARKYRLDRLGDVVWANTTARLVRELDTYNRPVTVHPVVPSSTHGPSPRDTLAAATHRTSNGSLLSRTGSSSDYA